MSRPFALIIIASTSGVVAVSSHASPLARPVADEYSFTASDRIARKNGASQTGCGLHGPLRERDRNSAGERKGPTRIQLHGSTTFASSPHRPSRHLRLRTASHPIRARNSKPIESGLEASLGPSGWSVGVGAYVGIHLVDANLVAFGLRTGGHAIDG